MQLFLKGENIHAVEVTDTQSVFELKCAIFSLEGIPADEQVLSYAGKPLSDFLTIAECGLNDLATLNVTGRVLGGKVHGSLARAGKVKGQTPKVDPQEKKKKKTGRAKRRMQYNHRFVNIVPGFGRRRGPNSNAP